MSDMTIVFLGCVSYNPISNVARVRYQANVRRVNCGKFNLYLLLSGVINFQIDFKT